MRLSLRPFILILALFAVPQSLFGTAQIQQYLMTKPAPPSSCTSVPQAYSSFSATEKEAYLWFAVTNANNGDVFASEYYTPSGQFYAAASGPWDPVAAGNWCFTDFAFEIAGHPPATLPGVWTVKGKLNGNTLFTLTFTITPATTLKLTINQAVTTNCPSNKLNVTVSDSAGTAITGLTPANFALTEGGQTRTATVTAVAGAAGQYDIAYTSGTPAADNTVGVTVTYNGQTASASTTVSKCSGGSATATVTGMSLEGGSYSNGTFSGNGQIWDTFTASYFVLAVSATDIASPMLNASNKSVNLSPGSYYIYTEPTSFGSAVRVTVKWSDGRTNDASVFTVGSLTTAGDWTRAGGSTALSLASTGITNANRISSTLTAGGSNDNVLKLTIGGSGGNTGGLTLNINQVIDAACPNDKIIVSVMNAGSPVAGLTASNFTLKEAGVQRTITVTPVTSSSTGALSLAILIDVSGSLSSTDLTNEKTAAKQLISQMSASDSVAVYQFTDDVTLLQDFSTDKTKLNAAVDKAGGGGSTALYKAVQTASVALGARGGRKAIVLMTDGVDTIGGVTIDQAIAAAKTAGVPVFPVGFGSSVSPTILTRFATETGGTFSPAATSADLQKILQSIGQVISSQYEIAYTSGAPTTDNTVDITITYNGQTATASRTVTKCSNATSNCTFMLQPQSLAVPAAGQSSQIIVITQAGCALSPSANVSWIHITGSNQGAVSYQVDANTGAARSGEITIGNRTVPVTQEGATSTCKYDISPTTNEIQALGGASSFRLTTGPGCAWTASASGGSWMHISTPMTGSSTTTFKYTVDMNTSTQARSADVTINGVTFHLSQKAGASATAPVIADNGIVNAASNRLGPVARGSFFTVYGSNIGPPGYQQVTAYPIPDTMGGVVVTVSQGSSYNRRAYLHFVSSVQINGILPSDVPLGDVQLTVSYNSVVSSTATITISDTSFGTFSAAGGPGPGIIQNYNSATDAPLNLGSAPAKPKQIAILWGTGLGPISTGDNNPPPGGNMNVPVQVSVGGKQANLLYNGRAPSFAGVDNIYFEVPADAPFGCSVPVQVTAGGQVANTVRMAISADGKQCQDTANPLATTPVKGGKSATVSLMRITIKGVIDSTKPAVDSTTDAGLAIFANVAAGGDLAYSPFMNLPPVGTCSSTNKAMDFGSVLGASGVSLDNSQPKMLDAGTELTVTGPKGTVKLQRFDPNSSTGPYGSQLGGTMPTDGSPTMPLFLEPGTVTLTGPGGKDVGAFTASLTIGNPLIWTNQAQITSINRSTGFTVTWTGGDSSQTVAIAGGSSNQKTKLSGGFICLAPAAAGTFNIPANVLKDLPVTGSVIGTSDTIGMLTVGSLPMPNPQKFTAPGLDAGYIFQTVLTTQSVTVK